VSKLKVGFLQYYPKRKTSTHSGLGFHWYPIWKSNPPKKSYGYLLRVMMQMVVLSIIYLDIC